MPLDSTVPNKDAVVNGSANAQERLPVLSSKTAKMTSPTLQPKPAPLSSKTTAADAASEEKLLSRSSKRSKAGEVATGEKLGCRLTQGRRLRCKDLPRCDSRKEVGQRPEVSRDSKHASSLCFYLLNTI